jgi:uncharacterized SAM-binding protein YcdF (DUF218 family)
MFAVVQMACFGASDYRRHADAIVVFGARAYADGRPSLVLRDRMATACELYEEGRAPLLVLSGGPGDGAHHETAVMYAFAREAGVPAAAILRDEDGVDTRATVRNSTSLLRARGAETALAVSHGYHLPRIRMTFEREGFAAYTVPARESGVLPKLPWYVAREAMALWAYFL